MQIQQKRSKTSPAGSWPLAASISLCTLAFGLDLKLPAGLSGSGALYMLPVLLTLWIPGTVSTIAFASVGLILTVIGHLLSPSDGTLWFPPPNRGVAIAAVLASASLVLLRKRSEAVPSDGGERFGRIADTVPGILWIMEPDYSVGYMNAYLRNLTGLTDDVLASTRWMELLHPDDRAAMSAYVQDHFETVRAFEVEFRLATVTGDYADILARGQPSFDHTGKLLGYIATGLDVTKQKRAEGRLRDSEAFLSRAQEMASVGSWIWERQSPTVQWSDQMYRIMGVDPARWITTADEFVEHLVHPEDRAGFIRGWQEFLRTRIPQARHYRIVRPTGEIRYVHSECDVVLDDDGRILRTLGTTQDVTERRLAEQILAESRGRLEYSERVAALGHADWDVRTGHEVWSDGLFHLLGLEPGEVEPSREAFAERIVLSAERGHLASRRHAIAAGEIEPGATYRVMRKDGVERDLRISGEVFKDADGNVERVFATAQDVTELMAAERALSESEERLELAALGANDGLWDWMHLENDQLWLSPRFYEVLGYEVGEFEPTCGAVLGAVHPDDAPGVVDAIALHLRGGPLYDVELRLLTKTGEYRWYRARGAAIFDNDGRATRIAGSLQDVHARRLAESAILRHREQLRHLVAQAALVAEKERNRIGGELHDRTLQNLGLTKVKLGALRSVAENSVITAQYDDLAALVDTTIQDARALLSEISPPVFTELGFEAAVDWLAEQTEEMYGLPCTVNDDGEARILDEDVKLVLFQAVRELLTNAGKHARARSAQVQISDESSQIVVCVKDDGIGFEAHLISESAVDHGGYGLFSIRERLRTLGGVLQIDSRANAGTAITVSVPIRH